MTFQNQNPFNPNPGVFPTNPAPNPLPQDFGGATQPQGLPPFNQMNPNQPPPIPPAQKSFTVTPQRNTSFGAKKQGGGGIFILFLVLIVLLQTSFIVYENILPYMGIEVPRLLEPNVNTPTPTTKPQENTDPKTQNPYVKYADAFTSKDYKITAQGKLELAKETETETGGTAISKFSVNYEEKPIYTKQGKIFVYSEENGNIIYFEDDGTIVSVDHEKKQFAKYKPGTDMHMLFLFMLGEISNPEESETAKPLTLDLFAAKDPLMIVYNQIIEGSKIIEIIDEKFLKTTIEIESLDLLNDGAKITYKLNCEVHLDEKTQLISKVVVLPDNEYLHEATELTFEYEEEEEIDTVKKIGDDYEDITETLSAIDEGEEEEDNDSEKTDVRVEATVTPEEPAQNNDTPEEE
jgi:hypothetical protein